MPTLHAHRSPLRSRQALARARLAILRAEVAEILQMFPELQTEIRRRPACTPPRSPSSQEARPPHLRHAGARRSAH
jgi:hypothetical protein